MRIPSVAAVCVAVLFLSAQESRAAGIYSITPIAPASPGGVSFLPNRLNNSGSVVGLDSGVIGEPSLLWQWPQTTVIPLGPVSFSSAQSINNKGTVVGYFFDKDQREHAFSFDGNKVTTLPAALGAANSINNSGVIAGTMTVNDHWNAAIFSAGQLTDLDPTPDQYSQAFAINDSGSVAGVATSNPQPDTHFEAVLWQGNKTTYLGDLGGGFSEPQDINSTNVVVGASQLPSGRQHGFVWQAGVLHDLGVLPGDTTSTASGINDLGQIVGFSASGVFGSAVLWQNSQMIDLNTLIPKNSGWDLQDAVDINDNGQIVGTGLFDGNESMFLLTLASPDPLDAIPVNLVAQGDAPVPEPSVATMLLVLAPLVAFSRRRRKRTANEHGCGEQGRAELSRMNYGSNPIFDKTAS